MTRKQTHTPWFLLATLLFSAGCYSWVPITRYSLRNGEGKIDQVRIGSEHGEVIDNVSIRWPLLTWATQGEPTTINLGEPGAPKPTLTLEDEDAIAAGKIRRFDELRIGGDLFVDATIKPVGPLLTGPILTGLRKRSMRLDLTVRDVYMEKLDSGPTAAFVLATVVGGIGISIGIGYLVWVKVVRPGLGACPVGC